MRLGAYPAKLVPGTKVYDIYGEENISERHRHRYEVNIDYMKQLQDAGLISYTGKKGSSPIVTILEVSTAG
jgi:CTP synthase